MGDGCGFCEFSRKERSTRAEGQNGFFTLPYADGKAANEWPVNDGTSTAKSIHPRIQFFMIRMMMSEWMRQGPTKFLFLSVMRLWNLEGPRGPKTEEER